MNQESEDGKQRLFIGIKASLELQQYVVLWQREHAGIHDTIRWIKPDNLHVTLIPPWNDNPEEVQKKLETFQNNGSPFEILLQRVSFGPRPKHFRFIWATGQTPRTLIDLRDELEKHLFGKQLLRKLTVHVTLARFKPELFPQFSTKQLEERVGWKQTVTEVTLFASHLKPDGSDYQVLCTVEL